MAVHDLVRDQIRRLVGPSIHCAEQVERIMIEAIKNAMDSEEVSTVITAFPSLGGAIARSTKHVIKEQIQISKEKIKDHIDMLASFVKVFDLDFQKSQVELLTRNYDARQPVVTPALVFNDSDEPVPFVAFEFNHKPRNLVKLPGAEVTGKGEEELEAGANNKKCEMVKEMVQQYFGEKRKNLQNYVPASLVHKVIYYAQDQLHTRLVRKS